MVQAAGHTCPFQLYGSLCDHTESDGRFPSKNLEISVSSN